MMKNSFIAAASSLLLLSACCGEKCNEKQQCQVTTASTPTASLAVQSGIAYSDTTPNKKDGKSVLVISSSPRKGGNTDILADAFVKGAQEAGGKVEKIFLADSTLTFLSEEGANKPKEVSRDNATGRIVEKFLAADVVVLAAPTYYMNVNDRMKTFIDATYLAFGDERMGGKEYYYITACADDSNETAEWCFNGFRGFVMCLPSATERGYVRAKGMGRAGAVKGTKYETQAYELGKTINK